MENATESRDIKIKVCGMRDAENIRMLADLNPDYIGFIFYPLSKRYAAALDKDLLGKLPSQLKKTGVFVNAELPVIEEKIREYALDAVQLHGNESGDLCKLIKNKGIEVIKAFGVDEGFDFSVLNAYEESVDYFLFDTKTTAHGGSGRTFDWSLLKKNNTSKSYFLSGGLDIENIAEVTGLEDSRLYALDLNSRFEIEPGLKDINKLNIIFNRIKRHSAVAAKEGL